MATRICLCCGKSYDYCPNCGKNSSTPWMFNYDTEACKEIFNAVSGYNMGIVNEEGVKKVLDKFSVTNIENYKDSIKEVLRKITKKTSYTKTEEIKEPVSIEESRIDSVVDEQNDIIVEDVPRRSRRNRYFE